MSPWRRKNAALDLQVGARDWQLCQADRVLAAASFGSLDELAASLASAPVDPSMQGARRMTVAVHAQWVRSFSIDPPSGLRGLAELRLLATTRMEHLFGADSQAWTLHGPWSPSRPFVVTAVPEALVQAARALCHRIGCRLAEVTAYWIRALAQQPPPLETQWAAILQPDVLTVVLLRERQPVFARAMRVVPEATDAQLRALAEREQVRLGIVGGKQLALGNTALMNQLGVPVETFHSSAESLRSEGASVMFLAVDGRPPTFSKPIAVFSARPAEAKIGRAHV